MSSSSFLIPSLGLLSIAATAASVRYAKKKQRDEADRQRILKWVEQRQQAINRKENQISKRLTRSKVPAIKPSSDLDITNN
ncbi:hypothetical protein [Pelagibaculum spongiae]|uniref:Uncharacterized protein n=1 Tax=Pelagibaculum spongiae TaxID=2080658 RepID=A0A2V1H0J7_9GAMM|nr:hypothetical protein [Pelagibaculum spongiae]PVZ72536.1 hypothetical protein DC094_05940 [Pelagibaculum spongiae]